MGIDETGQIYMETREGLILTLKTYINGWIIGD